MLAIKLVTLRHTTYFILMTPYSLPFFLIVSVFCFQLKTGLFSCDELCALGAAEDHTVIWI